MNPKVLTSQTPTPQIQELCDTPQIRKEENSIGETYTKHKKITLTNLSAEFMALKTFVMDELHSVNKNINLIKNNMNNGQILDDVKHLRDDNNSKNTIFFSALYNLHFFKQKIYIHQVLIYLDVPGIPVKEPLQNS